jgi:hypothetical protein
MQLFGLNILLIQSNQPLPIMDPKRTFTRRAFNQGSATVLLASALATGCAPSNQSYVGLVASTWRPAEVSNVKGQELLIELVRYGTLAANSHNTQPWLFTVAENRISLIADFSRRCPAVDPDDHHLYASLGCATENIVQAAQAYGLQAKVSIETERDYIITIDFEPDEKQQTALFKAIPERQCTRSVYDGKPVPAAHLSRLQEISRQDGINIQLFTTHHDLKNIMQFVIAGNSAQMQDPAFIAELKHWIRFSETKVTSLRDGLYSASSGNPTLPEWLGKTAFRFVFTENAENDKYREQILSSSGVIVFSSKQNNKQSWINAGRCYQRFALQATALGLRHAFINQAVEVPEVRSQFAEFLGIKAGRVDILVRFGYAPELPRSLRRPVTEVII